jgi:quercetin dioxygenase-like cupin family protein
VIAECGELCRSRTKHGQSEGVLQGGDRRRHIRHGKADLTETLSLLPLGESKRSAPNRGAASRPSGMLVPRQSAARHRSSRDTVGMQKISLEALARQQMKLAATAGGGHTADTVFGGHEKVMRQTLIGMVAGAQLAEHENPGEATVLILHGRVRLAASGMSWDAARGDMLIMPDHRHSLEALEDSAVLLTVAKLS